MAAHTKRAEVADGQSYSGYLLSTPQISDPLRPLKHATAAFSEIEIHAAVVTMADPLETHLARMFDMQLSSLIRAFHARSYVLDGFAFTWDPKRGGGLNQGTRLPEGGTRSFSKDQRDMPGVLVFRQDSWRVPDIPDPAQGEQQAKKMQQAKGVKYVVLFLVGESPMIRIRIPIPIIMKLPAASHGVSLHMLFVTQTRQAAGYLTWPVWYILSPQQDLLDFSFMRWGN